MKGVISLNIGNIKINGIASLAPMAGVTDRAFREICSIFGASYLTSEMVSVKGLIYGDKKTLELINHTKDDKPFSIQLFGRELEDFTIATEIISEYNPNMIDINMGCPAPKIVKSGAGSFLMKEPKLCGKIVSAVKKVAKVPVTVKIRSGFDKNSINAVEVSKECELYGADAITIHGRTREQMYSGKSNLDIIKDVKDNVHIPVIGNGDIVDYSTAKFMMDYTNCDMVAVGRGALGNPWIFKKINSKNDQFIPDIQERVKFMKLHLNKLISYKGEPCAMKEARKHLAWYIKGITGAAVFRKKIFEMKNYSNFSTICSSLLEIE